MTIHYTEIKNLAIRLFSSLKNTLSSILSLSHCLFCLERTKKTAVCPYCWESLPRIKHACRYCGIPIDHDLAICGICLTRPPIFHQLYALFVYEHPISQFLLQLKFQQQLFYAQLLGEWMGAFLNDKPKPDCIIPVPLHPKRIRERGYNQSLEIARPIAKALRIPLELSACKRIRYTQPQSELPENARKRNVKNAFEISTHFHARHIAIIDDIVTTGHTVSELARLFKKQGVEKIDIWCCAKTK